MPENNPDFASSDVQGIVYKIDGDDRLQVVTIYNLDIGLGVKAYVRSPELLTMIKKKDVCVGRFIVAHGVRTSDTTLEAEGIDVDQSTSCGTPPK